MAYSNNPCCKALVVLGVFLSNFLQYGLIYGVGIYYVVIAEAFSAGPTEMSLLCSAFTAIFFVISPISSILTNRFGCRPVTMIGGIIAGVGFVVSSVATNMSHLYFSFAVVSGVGLGLCSTPSIVIVPQYFMEKRAFAYGIGLSGVGFGAFGFPQIVSLLLHHYTLQGALLITGAVCFHMVLAGAIFREVQEDSKIKDNDKGDWKREFSKLLNLELFKDPNFLALATNCTLAGLGQTIVFVHIGAYAVSIGLSTEQSANVISVTGITNCAGRLFFGVLPMIKNLGKFWPYVTGLTLSGIVISSVAHVDSYAALCVVVGIFGFLFGAFGALEPQVTLEIVGERHLGSAFGFLQVFVAMGSLSGAPLAAVLFRSTSTYHLSFYLGGGAVVAAGVLAIIPWRRMRQEEIVPIPSKDQEINEVPLKI